MPKPKLRTLGHENPGPDALLDRSRVRGRDRHQQRKIDGRADHRRDVERPARRHRQLHGAREHRVTHGRRQPVGNGKRLGNEKRIASSRLEQATRIKPGVGRQCPDGVRGEPSWLDADDARRRRDLPREHADRLIPRSVVAVGHKQHRRNPLEPARGNVQYIQRRLVRPVAILHNDDRRALRGETRQQRTCDRREVRRLDNRLAQRHGDVVAAARAVTARPAARSCRREPARPPRIRTPGRAPSCRSPPPRRAAPRFPGRPAQRRALRRARPTRPHARGADSPPRESISRPCVAHSGRAWFRSRRWFRAGRRTACRPGSERPSLWTLRGRPFRLASSR